MSNTFTFFGLAVLVLLFMSRNADRSIFSYFPSAPLLPPAPVYAVGQYLFSAFYNCGNYGIPPQLALLKHSTGFMQTGALRAAAKLGVADGIDEHSEGVNLAELAIATDSHKEPLGRLLRALTTIGVFREVSHDTFMHTPMSLLLRSDNPDSLKGAIEMFGNEQYCAFSNLEHSIRYNEPGFKKFYGEEFWGYHDNHVEAQNEFNSAMRGLSKLVDRAISEDYDGFGKFLTICDIAGGTGALLMGVLSDRPHLSGILFDLPAVIQVAKSAWEEVPFANRTELVEGSFFDAASIPKGADAYIVKQILHDWNDEKAVEILRNIRSAMHSNSTLLIADRLVEPGGFVDTQGTQFADLLMLNNFGAKERTKSNFEKILNQANFKLKRIVHTRSTFVVIEATPTGDLVSAPNTPKKMQAAESTPPLAPQVHSGELGKKEL